MTDCYCKYSDTIPRNSDTFQCQECEKKFHYKCFKNTCLGMICISCLLIKEDPFKQKNDLFQSEAFYLPIKSNNLDLLTIKFSINNKLWPNDTSIKVSIFSFHISYDVKKLEWPKKVTINLNGNNIGPNLSKTPQYEITHLLTRENEIQLKYSNLENDRYLFVILPYQKIDKECLKLKNNYDEERCVKIIKDKLKVSLISQEKVSIIDPLTANIIRCPVNSKSCMHLQCFDLQAYIKGRFKKTRCPLCLKKLYFDDLYEDLYFRNVICNVLSEYEDFKNYEIFITSEAQWTAQRTNENLIPVDIDSDINSDVLSPRMKKRLNDTFEEEELEPGEIKEELEPGEIKDPINDPINDINEMHDSTKKISKNIQNNHLTGETNEYTPLLNDLYNLVKMTISNSSRSIKLILEDIYNNSKILEIMVQLPPYYLGAFLNNIKHFNDNLVSEENIFPHNMQNFRSYSLHTVCEELKNKHKQFFSFLSDWKFKNSSKDLIILIISYNRKINQGERITHDVYLTIEMLIAYTYQYYRPMELTITLEYCLGKMFSTYFSLIQFKHEEIAKIIDLLTELFPNLYLPTKNFSNSNQKKNYYEKLLRFYQGLMSNFKAEEWGNIFQHLLSPIKEEYEKLSHEFLIFIEDVEENFIFPLLKRMSYNKNDMQLFIDKFDTSGYFKDFLIRKRRLEFYGYVIEKKVFDSIYKDGEVEMITEYINELMIVK